MRLGMIVLALAACSCSALAARAETTQPLTQAEIRYWTAVGSCETGAGGPPKWDWGSKHRPGEGALFEGGLGFSALMWQQWAAELGLGKVYPHAYDAPPLVQIRVAAYGAKTHGARWGCKP